MHSVSIIIPTLNEAENIDLLLTQIFSIKDLQDFDIEVVFSDGASTDSTCSKIRKWIGISPVKLVESDVNKGLSAAVIAGANAARGDYVVVMDADLSHPPDKIPALIQSVVSGSHEMAIGSRYVRGGTTPDWPGSRKISSILATLPARIFTDVKDPLAGFFCTKKHLLTDMAREVSGFKIGLELLATAKQPFRACEIPITFRDRCYGDSKMGLSVIYDYLKQLFQLVGIHATHSYTLYGVVGMLFCMAVTDFSLMYLLVSNGFSVLKASWVSFPTAACIAAGMILFTSHVSGREKKLFLKSAAAVYGGGLLLFLRSAMIIHYPELVSSILGMIALAVVSCLLAYFASICFVFSIGRKRVSGEVVIRFYLIAAILYLFILRLVYLGLAAPCLEESFVVDKFHSGVLATSVMREMLGQTISRWIGSFTELGIYELRLTAEATWWVGLICMFNLARDVHDRATGFKTILLFAVLPFTFGTTFYLTKDAILLLLWTASLYVLYRFLVVGARTAWVAAAIIPVITAAYDPLGGILIIGSFLYIGIKCGSPVWRKDNKLKNWCYTVLATFTIFFVLPGKPVQHSSFVGAAWIDEILGLPLTANPLLLLILVTPVPIMATIACYMQSRKTGVELPYPFRDFLDKDKKLFFGMHFLLPLATGLLASIATGNYMYSSSVVWLGALPCIALTYTKDDGEDGVMVASLLYRGWWVTVLLLIPVYGGVLLRQSL